MANKKTIEKTVEFLQTKDEEITITKAKNGNKEKSPLSKIANVVLWIILFVWMGICLIDFYNVHQKKEPVFCITKKTTKYDDGEVNSCLGLGYKVYKYDRQSFNGIEFGPFWSKDRSATNNK